MPTRCSPNCDHLEWQIGAGDRLRICELENSALQEAECDLRDLILDSDEGAGFIDDYEEYEWLESDADIDDYQVAMQKEIRRRGLPGIINKRYLANVCGGDIELYWED
jgi:hypothetical protein